MNNRYKITIEYLGTKFVGWQRQLNGSSVQQSIELAIYKLAGEETVVYGAGRTDAGVHALGQVAHFDLLKEFTIQTIKSALNFYLKNHNISIIKAEIVDFAFHARFSAIGRSYRYVILNRNSPSPINNNLVWQISHPLDITKMQQAANLLLGSHDFTSFRAIQCQAKSPIKTLEKINLTKNEEFIYCDLTAPSFLHHMVRNIIGTLYYVGIGKWSVEKMSLILASKLRKEAGITAPACGLYLSKVDY